MRLPARCSECGGAMKPGFVVDQSYGTFHVSTWQEGEPRKSFWTGVKRAGAERIEITTLRCEKCGHLKSYAVPQ